MSFLSILGWFTLATIAMVIVSAIVLAILLFNIFIFTVIRLAIDERKGKKNREK